MLDNFPEFKHQKSRILILGYGDIARRIIKQKLNNLSSKNIKFLTVSRSDSEFKKSFETKNTNVNNFSHISIDLDTSARVKRIVHICDRVIVLFPTKKADSRGIEANYDRRANIISSLIKKTIHNKVKGVYISTTGVYGDANGALIDETYKCAPLNKRSKRRLSAENYFRKRLNFNILRVPGIYSDDRLPTDRLKAQRPILNDKDDIYTNHIHADDLARVVFVALFRGLPSRVINVIDDSNLKMGEYMRLIAKKFKLKEPPSVDLNDLKKKVSKGEISAMAGSFFLESRQIKNDRLKEELQIRLKFPTVKKTLKEIK